MTTRSGSGTAQSIQIKTKNERRSPISHHLDLSLTHLYVLKSDKENQGVQEKKQSTCLSTVVNVNHISWFLILPS